MKKLVQLLVAGLFVASMATAAYGQGQVNFFTFNSDASKGKISFALPDGDVLGGSGQWGQLLGGTSADALTPIGAPTEFLLGGGAPSGVLRGGTVTIDGVPGGSAYFIAVAAWDATIAGADYASASAAGVGFGVSETLSVSLGGAPAGGGAPLPPPQINGFANFTVPVPEPSTIALGILGGLALMFFRRK